MELLDKVHLQRAANTTILQGNEVIVLLRYYSTLLNERSIDIYFTYIIDYYSKSYPLPIREDTIKKSSFAATEITR